MYEPQGIISVVTEMATKVKIFLAVSGYVGI
jgi:hypothetical protein